MFCTKCGKELHKGDNFCAYCGNKVRPDVAFEKNTSRYSEVVFNPPFKVEAQRKTEEIAEGFNGYSQEPKRESLQFDWNLDGFPGSSRKKEDDFKFNWDDVLEKKRDSREIEIEKILFAAPSEKEEKPVEKPMEVEKPVVIEAKEEVKEEPKDLFADLDVREKAPLSIEALEKELFGETPESDEKKENLEQTKLYEAPKDKFFTYNAKKDAFQELLDKERERVQQMEAERKAQWKDFTLSEEQMEKKPNEALSFEEVFREPKIFTGDILREVAVVLPPLTPAVMAWEEEETSVPIEVAVTEVAEEVAEDVKEEKAEVIEEALPFLDEPLETKNKTKLRFSDVFPREDLDVDNGSDDDSDDSGKEEEPQIKEEKIETEAVEDKAKESAEETAEDDEEQEKKPKRHGFLKFIIVLLSVLIVAEMGVIGVKMIAPDSAFAQKVDGLVGKVIGIFTGSENEIEAIVENLSQSVAHIDEMKVDSDLKYDLTKEQAFDGVIESSPFEDSAWIQNSDGTVITYGQGIVEGLITYYDQLELNDKLADGLVGINKLEIGEIRTGGDGYYVLSRVTYKGEDGEVVKYETAYLKAGAQLINVKDVKEETL